MKTPQNHHTSGIGRITFLFPTDFQTFLLRVNENLAKGQHLSREKHSNQSPTAIRIKRFSLRKYIPLEEQFLVNINIWLGCKIKRDYTKKLTFIIQGMKIRLAERIQKWSVLGCTYFKLTTFWSLRSPVPHSAGDEAFGLMKNLSEMLLTSKTVKIWYLKGAPDNSLLAFLGYPDCI